MIKLILYKKKLDGNLELTIEGFKPKFQTETYWLNTFLHGKNDKQDLISFINENLRKLKEEVISMEINKKVFYPFDISDQHIGFLVIKKLNKKVLNCYVVQSMNLGGGDISPIFDSSFNLKDEDGLIILDGQIIHLDDFCTTLAILD